jgi:CRISPR-associated endonuclease Csn1
MYTNEPLDIHNLSAYEVDHIIPRSLKPDNSIDNKVLVKKVSNQRKKDDIVLDPNIINRQKEYWKKLKEHGLMSSQKYYALTRTEYSDPMLEGFVNRQLVETRQISKQVVKVLQDIFPTTNVVSVRAPLVSEFRRKHNIYKLREVNDYHHAHDAYIIAILGYYLIRRYPTIYNGEGNGYKEKIMKKQLLKGGYSIVSNSMNTASNDSKTEKEIWNPTKIKEIKEAFYYKDCFITRKLEPQTGGLFNVTVLPGDRHSDNGKTKAKLPVNKNRNDTAKYGGFNTQYYAYYYLVQYQDKKTVQAKIVGIPIYLSKMRLGKSIEYLQKELGTKQVHILSGKIYKYQNVQWRGQPHYITGPGELINGRQLILDEKHTAILYNSKTFVEKEQYQELNAEELNELFEYILKKYEMLYKTYNSTIKKINDFREKFYIFPPKNKVLFILEMLKLSKTDATNPGINSKAKIGLAEEQLKEMNVSENFFSSREGRLSKQIISNKETIFINQSITGIYQEEKEYELEDFDDN